MAEGGVTPIQDLKALAGSRVTLAGWLYNNRPSGGIVFLIVRDGTGLCQCVAEKGKVGDELFEKLRHLGQESSLRITGTVRADERSAGGYELAVTGAEIIHEAADYPITPKSHGINFLLKNRHLHLRSSRQWAIGKIRHTVVDATRRFFNENGFVLVDTPVLTPVAGEEVESLFKVDYFGTDLVLAQTGQLYLEAAASAYGKVYCFGPTFRAEKSKTRRHLTEFWMAEPEVAFIDLEGLLVLAERFVSSITKKVLENNRPQLEMLGADIAALEKITPPFGRMTYTQAVELLRGEKVRDFLASELDQFGRQRAEVLSRIDAIEKQQKGSPLKKWQADKIAAELIELRGQLAELEAAMKNNPKHAELAKHFEWGKDLGGSDETIISRMSEKPVFITRYPKQAKAFYMKTDRSDESVVLNLDLLAPGGFGEIIGGSVREDDHDKLLDAIREKGLDPENYRWYLDLRRYGSVPHGGFGLGIERTVAWLTGERHIRQCIAFPRMMDNVYM
jgi:asparaginyl-tRNA synthetase